MPKVSPDKVKTLIMEIQEKIQRETDGFRALEIQLGDANLAVALDDNKADRVEVKRLEKALNERRHELRVLEHTLEAAQKRHEIVLREADLEAEAKGWALVETLVAERNELGKQASELLEGFFSKLSGIKEISDRLFYQAPRLDGTTFAENPLGTHALKQAVAWQFKKHGYSTWMPMIGYSGGERPENETPDFAQLVAHGSKWIFNRKDPSTWRRLDQINMQYLSGSPPD